ncbi:hypothetical protein AGOR_G00131240 [Albula goreensis]|uniref:Uncharacterized protein n=1 Tax=Albula goreensis TaxID=1534307 RepID=A0A8T3D847_9TELE|nr:hypothetical protein AGOR_G00131240 [Albula goreensis]
MASTQTLQEHNHNRTGREDTRNAKHPVKGSADVGSRPSKPNSAPKASKRGAENQDPSGRVGKGTATGKQMGSSRLPVLARSQPLQPHTDFSQVHKKWEENFQKGKAQKKKPCTKFAPFSLSQPQASRAATSSQQRVHPTNTGAAKPNDHSVSQSAAPPTAAVHFSPDPAALSSILQNEGVKAGAPFGVTPRSSVCPTGRGTSVYLPQRVSVVKSHPAAGPGSGGMVQFSPDPAALRSILQNEGVKAGGPLGATPKSSICPTGRGTSVYLPQRVPVAKATGEATTAGAVQSTAALSQTPAVKWTPQRIPNTRPQSMMRHLSSHRTPMFLGSPHLRSLLRPGKDPLGPHKEEPVVQKLFEEEEEEGAEPKVNIGEERVTDRMKDQPTTPETECAPSLSGGGEEEEGVVGPWEKRKPATPSRSSRPLTESPSSSSHRRGRSCPLRPPSRATQLSQALTVYCPSVPPLHPAPTPPQILYPPRRHGLPQEDPTVASFSGSLTCSPAGLRFAGGPHPWRNSCWTRSALSSPRAPRPPPHTPAVPTLWPHYYNHKALLVLCQSGYLHHLHQETPHLSAALLYCLRRM